MEMMRCTDARYSVTVPAAVSCAVAAHIERLDSIKPNELAHTTAIEPYAAVANLRITRSAPGARGAIFLLAKRLSGL